MKWRNKDCYYATLVLIVVISGASIDLAKGEDVPLLAVNHKPFFDGIVFDNPPLTDLIRFHVDSKDQHLDDVTVMRFVDIHDNDHSLIISKSLEADGLNCTWMLDEYGIKAMCVAKSPEIAQRARLKRFLAK